MERFFKYNKELVFWFKVLIEILSKVETILEFHTIGSLKGYNLEKLQGSNLYSIRIIPKKRKFIERLLFFVIDKDGKEIRII